MTLPESLQAVVRDPLSAARASPRPVVGFVSNNVPIELIHAAGCFPLQLPTAPRADTRRADRYLEAHFEPMARSALELLLAGELDCASLLVLPRTFDAWQRLYYYLCELGRSFGQRVPEPFLYDLLHTPQQTSADHNAGSTRALADRLAALGALSPSALELAPSIALYNRIRAKLERVMARRRARPCLLSGAEALELYCAAQRIEPERFELALDALLQASGAPAHGTRTIVIGSAHDTPALHRSVARAGGQVVADYHWHGELLFGPELREDIEPLQALVEHYHRDSWSPRKFPLPLPPLLELASQCHAEAAVFFYYSEEEALTWDYPEQQAALRACGLSTLLLEREAYPPSAEVEARLRQFFLQPATPQQG